MNSQIEDYNSEQSEGLVNISRRKSTVAANSNLPGVFIKTYGCQMNEYDTEKLKKILESQYKPVDSAEDAELILINTCSVRDKPEQKLYSMLGQLQDLKRKNPKLMVGVGGCVAQQEGEKIVKRSKTVDLVFGTHNLSLVPSMVELRKNGGSPQVAVDYRDEWEELPAGFRDVDRVSAFVSISRGCNKNCTYCIVPTTRGVEVSRHPNEVLREVRIAAHRGAKEICLLGQTVNSYGRDLNPKMTFVELMKKVAEVEQIKRIRFTSPHPQEIRSDFIDLVCDNPKVTRHVHMPLQAGSDRILKLMNRNYRKAKYLSIIDAIYSRVPDMSITTDIIVGFPGETESEFLETVDLMKQVQFENSYSFIYSPRPGTVAADMEDLIPYEEKLRWLQHLQKVQEEISGERLKKWVDKEVEVLIDSPTSHNPELMQGRVSQNIVVNLTEIADRAKPGQFVQVKINKAHRYTLSGVVV
jgi:tRNA-2-methylthio-N6-dimethylallyladenosine synthase